MRPRRVAIGSLLHSACAPARLHQPPQQQPDIVMPAPVGPVALPAASQR